MITIVVPVIVTAQLGTPPAGYRRYESGATQIAFYYPQEWFVIEQDESPVVVSREALGDQLNRDQPDLQPGDTVLVMGVLPSMFMAMMGIPIDDVESIADGLFENMIAQSGEIRDGQVDVQSFGGREIATIVFDDAEDELSGMIAVVHEQEDVIGFGMVLGFREDLLRRRERVARTVSSLEFTGDFAQMLGQ